MDERIFAHGRQTLASVTIILVTHIHSSSGSAGETELHRQLVRDGEDSFMKTPSPEMLHYLKLIFIVS
jgi:hypothetical protein